MQRPYRCSPFLDVMFLFRSQLESCQSHALAVPSVYVSQKCVFPVIVILRRVSMSAIVSAIQTKLNTDFHAMGF